MLWIAALGALVIAPAPAAFGGDRNACGCYQTDGGSCYCDKKAKCGCPGECEPKGCEEKRQKQLDKEVHEETKRAQDASRTQDQAAGRSGLRTAAAHEREKAPAAAPKGLTAAQTHELSKLLEQYVAAHPGESGKGIAQLSRELASAPR
jgi:hypothetical protein